MLGKRSAKGQRSSGRMVRGNRFSEPPELPKDTMTAFIIFDQGVLKALSMIQKWPVRYTQAKRDVYAFGQFVLLLVLWWWDCSTCPFPAGGLWP